MSDSLKEISESIDAVRAELSHLEGSPGGHPDIAEGHFDILLAQVAAELRRAARKGESTDPLRRLLERESR